MRILVFSDSHAGMRFMRKCVEIMKPDAMVHLGDYYDDGETLAETFPGIPMHQVAGNCDKFRSPIHAREWLCYDLGGVRACMTHGHRERVKSGTGGLVAEARRNGAQIALYGHTHIPDCHQESDGLWVLNPGSAGHSAGVLVTDGQKITACYLLTEKDLEEIL